MPGYRSLSSHISGTAAEHARQAELRQRDGDPEAAARLLEEALEASKRVRAELPGWVCGRLASIYRTLKRYDDEVMLLERYRESQTSEEARTRFDARLSKARAIAERKRRPETGALATVREVRDRSSLRRRTPPAMPAMPEEIIADHPFDSEQLDELRTAVADMSADRPQRLQRVMKSLCADAREMRAPMESLVAALKQVWTTTPAPSDLTEEAWRERYASSLVDLLAVYFDEAE
jgi:hypothetical protein